MNKVESLMALAWDFANAWRQGPTMADARRYESDLRTTLTTTLEAYEARIAELESLAATQAERIVADREHIADMLKDLTEEQSFLDAAAIALFPALCNSLDTQVRGMPSETLAEWSFGAAHALLAERRKRMVTP